MAIEFNTTRYEFSHGKKPRGRGYWAFEIRTNYGTDIFCWNGSYSEAKREAAARAKALGAYRVTVGA